LTVADRWAEVLASGRREGVQGVQGGASQARARREKRARAEEEDGSERAVETMRKRGGR